MKVKLWANCNFLGTEQEDTIEVPDDTTDDELDTIAKDFMNETLAPEWGFKRIADEE